MYPIPYAFNITNGFSEVLISLSLYTITIRFKQENRTFHGFQNGKNPGASGGWAGIKSLLGN